MTDNLEIIDAQENNLKHVNVDNPKIAPKFLRPDGSIAPKGQAYAMREIFIQSWAFTMR